MSSRQSPIAYTNRRGDTYYLHAGTTKTGKPRYFAAKAIGAGALATMPDGFEIVESINGVVSVRRLGPNAPAIDDRDLDTVRRELARLRHLRRHRADVVKSEVVIFEPVGIDERTRYTPVMKFVRTSDGYDLHRMTYRGGGGWSWPIASGPLATLVTRYAKHIGTDKFFELD